MSYTIPEMPLICDIRHLLNNESNAQAIARGANLSNVPCQIAWPTYLQGLGAPLGYTNYTQYPIIIRLPWWTDVADGFGNTSVSARGNGDIITIPQQSNYHFGIWQAVRVGAGFLNDHMLTLCQQITQIGWADIAPAPARLLLGRDPKLNPLVHTPPPGWQPPQR